MDASSVNMEVSSGFRRLSYALVIMTYLLILLGGYVKAIGAGLSCPDWPLCYGKLFPFFDGNVYPFEPYMIFFEWFHRLIAVSAGFVMLIIWIKSIKFRYTHRPLFTLSSVGLILFVAQGLFGALTVLALLDPIIVVAHLGTAVLIVILEMIIAFLAYTYSNST